MLVLQSHLKLQKLQPRCCLVKMKKAQNLCVYLWEKYCVQGWNYFRFQASTKGFRTYLLPPRRATATRFPVSKAPSSVQSHLTHQCPCKKLSLWQGWKYEGTGEISPEMATKNDSMVSGHHRENGESGRRQKAGQSS